MTQSDNSSSWRPAPARSVGSLPAPVLPVTTLIAPSGVAPRLLAGHWFKAQRAERAVGAVLWVGLAAVIVLLSA